MISQVKTDPFSFRCVVNKAGYEWSQGLLDTNDYLVPKDAPDARILVRDTPNALFQEFARLRATRDAIVEFAGKYGDLLSKGPFVAVIGTTPLTGTSFGRWKAEIGDMRVIVGLWEDIEQKREERLRKIVTIDSSKGVRYAIRTPKGERRRWLQHPDLADSSLTPFKPGDVFLPARYALQYEINTRLADTEIVTIPQLAWTPDQNQRLIFKPSSILAAMWLQLSQAVTGELQLKICEACGKYFQAGPGGRRADATTCSDACRQRKRRMTQR